MSKTKLASILYRISSAYYQIYKDAHNCTLLPPLNGCLPQSDIFDIEKIMDLYAVSEYQKHCFLQPKDREYYVQKAWVDKSKKWLQLSDDEKKESGKERASQHNKSQKRKLSFNENVGLFQDLVALCMEKNINLVIVVTPGTKYYRANLWEGFKESFYNVLNDADGVIHLLDLFDDESFGDEDFVDLDHLNEFGAKKMTGAILELLDGLEKPL